MENIKSKFNSLKNDKQFIKELKNYIIALMIVVYGYIANIMYDKSQLKFMLVCGGLLIFDLLLYRILDAYYMKVVLKDIMDLNIKSANELQKLKYYYKDITEKQKDIHKLGAKYERCWNTMKFAAKNSDNTSLSEAMEKIESIVSPAVDEELEKIWKENGDN